MAYDVETRAASHVAELSRANGRKATTATTTARHTRAEKGTTMDPREEIEVRQAIARAQMDDLVARLCENARPAADTYPQLSPTYYLDPWVIDPLMGGSQPTRRLP